MVAGGVAWSPEAWHGRRRRGMVRNAGGVACNSLGCKPQDDHPVNRTPEGWHEPMYRPRRPHVAPPGLETSFC